MGNQDHGSIEVVLAKPKRMHWLRNYSDHPHPIYISSSKFFIKDFHNKITPLAVSLLFQ
jgi:hypothetical protein